MVQRGDPAFRTTSAFELTSILVDTVDRRLLALDAATDPRMRRPPDRDASLMCHERNAIIPG